MVLGISSFRMDGKDYILSGCEDRSFKILDMNTGKAFATFCTFNNAIVQG